MPRDNIDLFLGKGFESISPLLPGQGRLRLGAGVDQEMILGDLTLSHRFHKNLGVFAKGSVGYVLGRKREYWAAGAGLEVNWE